MKKIIASIFTIIIIITTIHMAFSVMDMGLGTFSLTRIYSSSYHGEKGKPSDYYSDTMMFDHKPETAWCKAREEKDKDVIINVSFKPFYTDSIYILNGYGANKSLYYANNRIKEYEVTVTFKDGTTMVKKGVLSDNKCLPEYNADSEGNYKCRWDADPDYEVHPDKLVDFGQGKPRCVTGLNLKIISVYPGKKYKDTCIAEIGPVFNAGWIYDDPDYVKKCKACCDNCCAIE